MGSIGAVYVRLPSREGKPSLEKNGTANERTSGTTMRREIICGTTVHIAGGSDREGGGDGPLVVLLHGFGAPGADLVPLYRQLDVPPGVRFAFPEAPLDLGATLGPGYAGARAWWMIDPAIFEAAARGERSDRSQTVPDGLSAARTHIVAVLEQLSALLGVSRDRTVLGGFSQGAMLSLDLALRTDPAARRGAFAGLVLMSGTLVALGEWTPLLPKVAGVPILQSHGRTDPLLSFEVAERMRDLLREAGADVRFIEFGGGHTITGGVLDGVSTLLRDAFGAA
jgi:phospholipase/carboxylesterase